MLVKGVPGVTGSHKETVHAGGCPGRYLSGNMIQILYMEITSPVIMIKCWLLWSCSVESQQIIFTCFRAVSLKSHVHKGVLYNRSQESLFYCSFRPTAKKNVLSIKLYFASFIYISWQYVFNNFREHITLFIYNFRPVWTEFFTHKNEYGVNSFRTTDDI